MISTTAEKHKRPLHLFEAGANRISKKIMGMRLYYVPVSSDVAHI
jgi:hypothetical protein